MKVVTKNHRQHGDENIPSIRFEELVEYLGVEIRPDGSIRLSKKIWNSYLSNSEKAHLNPIQKIFNKWSSRI